MKGEDRHTKRWMAKQAGRQTDEKTDRQTERQTGRQAGRQAGVADLHRHTLDVRLPNPLLGTIFIFMQFTE